MKGASIDREVSKCQNFFIIIIMQTDYIIPTNLKPSVHVSMAKLAYAVQTINSIIRPLEILNYNGYKVNQVS